MHFHVAWLESKHSRHAAQARRAFPLAIGCRAGRWSIGVLRLEPNRLADAGEGFIELAGLIVCVGQAKARVHVMCVKADRSANSTMATSYLPCRDNAAPR